MASLEPCELLEARPFEHFSDVQIADRIGPDAVWTPELAWIVAAFAAKAADDVALQVDNTDPVLELRDVHHAVRTVVQLGGALETGPHVEIVAVGREDLDAVVLAVGDVHLALVLPDRI